MKNRIYASNIGALALLFISAGCNTTETQTGSESHFVRCDTDTDCTTGTCSESRGVCVDDDGEPISAGNSQLEANGVRSNDPPSVGSPQGTDAGGSSQSPPAEPEDFTTTAFSRSGGEYPRSNRYELTGDTLTWRSQYPVGFEFACESQLPECGADTTCQDDIQRIVADPEVQMALSGPDQELFGCDNRPVDGVVADLDVDGRSLLLGEPLDFCTDEPGKPIPASLRRLETALFALATQQQPECESYQSPRVEWGYTGGFVAYQDQSTLEGRTFTWVRQAGLDPDAGQQCESQMPNKCDLVPCTLDIAGALDNPVVQSALESGGLWGYDSRPEDGRVFRFAAQDSEILIGETCPDFEPACEDAPLELRQLQVLLEDVTAQQLRADGCTTVVPTP